LTIGKLQKYGKKCKKQKIRPIGPVLANLKMNEAGH
jgi:hypothetical protein